jgi:predicted DNA-binding ribbon-helix-helix protein
LPRAISKRSVIVAGHRSSVSLESEFWDELKQIAATRGLSINDLITEIDKSRTGNLSSAIRLHILATLRARLAGGTGNGHPPPVSVPSETGAQP